MKLAIMQPYFLPYIGYYQLANSVDTFIIYDNLKYTKKGWINRNRYKVGNSIKTFTLALEKASDHANIEQRQLARSFDRNKSLHTLLSAYQKAPFFKETQALLTSIYQYPENNLFGFIKHSLQLMFEHLAISTPLISSSDIPINHELKSEQKVIALCKAMGANTYINPPGGTKLYLPEHFIDEGIELTFIQPALLPYGQGEGDYVAALSIVDLLMRVGRHEVITKHLQPDGYITSSSRDSS